MAEQFLVPTCIERELVIGDSQSAALDRRQVLQHDNRHVAQTLRPGRPEASFTRNQPAVRSHEDWVDEAEFADGGSDLRHLLGGVCAGIAAVWNQPVDRPELNLDIQSPHKFAPPKAPSGGKAGGVV